MTDIFSRQFTKEDVDGIGGLNPASTDQKAPAPADPRQSLYGARTLNPDSEAAAQRLAREAGVTVEAARERGSEIQFDQKFKAVDFDRLAKDAPTVSKWLGNQGNANIASDDVDPLVNLEAGVRGLVANTSGEIAGNAIGRGVVTLQEILPAANIMANTAETRRMAEADRMLAEGASKDQIRIRLGLAGAEYAALPPEERQKRMLVQGMQAGAQTAQDLDQIRIIEDIKKTYPMGADMQRIMASDSFLEQIGIALANPLDVGLDIGLESAVASAPGLVAAPVLGPAAIGAGSAAASAPGALLESLKRQGVDVSSRESMQAATLDRGIMLKAVEDTVAYTGAIGMLDFVSGGVAGKFAPFGRKFSDIATREVGTITSAGQKVANAGVEFGVQGALGAGGEAMGQVATGQELDPTAMLLEFLGEGLVGGPTEGASIAIGELNTRREAASRAAKAEAFLTDLNERAKATKVLQRDPDALAGLINEMAEQGGAPNKVFIDSGDLNDLLLQSNMTVSEFADMLPAETGAQVIDAVMTGGTVEIPIGEHLTRVMDTDIGKALLPHVRLEEDGYSTEQAKQFLAEYEDRTSTEAEKILRGYAEDSDFRRSATEIRNQVERELLADPVANMTPEQARKNARLTEAFYVTAARDWGNGMTPGELFKRVMGDRPVVTPYAVTGKAGETIQQDEQLNQNTGEVFENPAERIEVSTTVPTAKSRGEVINDAKAQKWLIDESDVRATEKHLDAAENAIKNYNALTVEPGEDAIKKLIDVVADNLVWLHEKMPANIRERAKLWYDGANRIAKAWSKSFALDERKVAGVLAVLSPQKDWFMNVSLGERLITIFEKHANEPWSPQMTAWVRSYVGASKSDKEFADRSVLLEAAERLEGKTLSEMDDLDAAKFIRVFDETFFERKYRVVTPEGGFGEYVTNKSSEEDVEADDVAPGSVAWGGYSTIAKGVKILRASPDQVFSIVSDELGGMHKVRNFYNNIIAPNSADGHVTIDTHAIAAALFKALSGQAIEVMHNFGGTVLGQPGAGGNAQTGASGTYGIFADAYREAAARVGILPREMQSITWEAIRSIFTPSFKNSRSSEVEAIFNRYKAGEITREEARQQAYDIAGGLKEMAWEGTPEGAFPDEGGVSFNADIPAEIGDRQARLLPPVDYKQKLSINLSAATGTIPGLNALFEQANKGDLKAHQLLQDIALDNLRHLLSGTQAKLKAAPATGLYGGAVEPSVGITLTLPVSERAKVLAAVAKFAQNFNQEQVHVSQPTKDKVGTKYEDGSYATPHYRWKLTRALSRDEIQSVIDSSGLFGLTFGDDFVEAYFVGDSEDEKTVAGFEESIRRAEELLGGSSESVGRTTRRLWPYGSVEGSIGYERIAGDVSPSAATSSETAKRVAEFLSGQKIKPVKQAAKIEDSQRKLQEFIAATYDAMPDNALNTRLVKKAYAALAKETIRQFKALPIKVEILEGQGEPYKNSDEMRADVLNNNHLFIYATTTDTFGPPGEDFSGHPLLADSGITDANGKPLLINDLFRAIHDYYAHTMSPTQFGPLGEEAAWKNHMAMTTDPLARWALTSETRGQNSWVNFNAGVDQATPIKDRPFARQKAVLLPIEFAMTGDSKVDKPMREFAAQLSDKEKSGTKTAKAVVMPSDDTLFQDKPAGIRGTFNTRTLAISMTKANNYSTFIHESGHAFLDITMILAQMPDAPPAVKQRAQAILDWLGIESTPEMSAMDVWLSMTLDEKRQHHEKWAETFEQYTMTGKAPSLDLADAFDVFRDWMVRIYQSVKQFLKQNKLADLDEEVTAIFDRMLATDEQIAEAKAARAVVPLFTSKPESMTVEQWRAYQEQLAKQDRHDRHVIDRKKFSDMKWLRTKAGKVLRDLQREVKDKRDAMKIRAKAAVLSQPEYRARQILTAKIDENGVPVGEDGMPFAMRLNRAEFKRRFPNIEVGTTALRGMFADDGMPLDMAAEMLGFKEARSLVAAILDTKPISEAIEEMTDRMMLERYGDITSPEAMQRAVDEAISGQARVRIIASEIAIVANRIGSESALAKAAMDAARRIVDTLKVGQVRPHGYRLAATRASREAMKALKAGDDNLVLKNKRTEALNTALFDNASKTRAEIAKKIAGFRKIMRGKNEDLAKSRNMDLVGIARAVLAERGIGSESSIQSAESYYITMLGYDPDAASSVRSMLDMLPPAKDYKDMTVAEFRAMADIVDGIFRIAKNQQSLKIAGERIALDTAAKELTDRVKELTGGVIPKNPLLKGTATRFQKFIAGARGVNAMLIRVEAWCDMLGPQFTKYIYQPVSQGISAHRNYRAGFLEKYRNILKEHEKNLTFTPINAEELDGFVFNGGKLELLHALLHTGNASNKRKLLLGMTDKDTGIGWAIANGDNVDTSPWDSFIKRMEDEGVLTKADYDFCQKIWDLMEEMKPDAQRAHHEMYGYYFDEITAAPITTKFGTYRGGYVPAIADRTNPKVAPKVDAEELLHAGNSFMFPSTGKGFTKGRVEFNEPLELDLRTIGTHIDKVSRFVNIEPAIHNAARLLKRDDVSAAIESVTTDGVNGMLIPWLQRSARQTVSKPGMNKMVDKFWNYIRRTAGASTMAGNVINVMQQATGLSVAAVKVPLPYLKRALWNFKSSPKVTVADIISKSPWMRDRMMNQSMEMQAQIDKIMIGPGIVGEAEKAREFILNNAYFLQQAVQNMIDPVVWMGAYDYALSKGVEPEQAILDADAAVRLTQGSFAPEDIAAFEANTPFARIFFQFAGYFSMLANLMGAEAVKSMREAGYMRRSTRLTYIWLMTMSIPAMLAQMMSEGAPDDEDDEDGDGTLDEWLAMFFGSQASQAAAMVPIAGAVVNSALNQFDDVVYNDRLNVSPVLSWGERAITGIRSSADVAAAVAEDGEAVDAVKKRDIKESLTLVSLLTGLPTGQIGKTAGYALDVQQGNVAPESVTDLALGLARGR